MGTLLSGEREALINQIIASGRFTDADDVIDEALRHLAERERRLAILRGKLQSGLDQIAKGETRVFTADWSTDRLRIARERVTAGDIPNPDVCS